jgi:hypothetical protein
MANLAELPADVKSLIQNLSARNESGVHYLDPQRPEEKEAIEHLLDRSEKEANDYPALYGSIGSGEANSSPRVADRCRVIDSGRTEDGRATARTWVQSPGGAFISGVHTLMLDAETGETLASGSHTQVGGGLVRNATAGDDAKEARERMTAVSFFHAQRSPEDPVRFGLAATPVAAPNTAPVQTTVVDPYERKQRGRGYVTIGLSRQGDGGDCDYFYPEAQNVEPDRLVCPLTATAKFLEPISRLPTAANIRAGLWSQGQTVELLPGFPVQNGISISSEDNTLLEIHFRFDGKSIAQTESLQFQPLAVADDNSAYLFFECQVPLQNGPMTITICSKDWPEDPHSDTCTEIEDLKYWWHCIQADAQVRCANGDLMPIESVDNGTEVLLEGGGTATVQATTLDRHDDEGDDPLFKLETASGRQLILSRRHPVITPQGPMATGEVQPGVLVVVEGGGTDEVVSCTQTQYSGSLCNLKFPTSQAFYANGIAVGDFGAVEGLYEANRHDPDRVLPQLPESHHKDFLSALGHATSR